MMNCRPNDNMASKYRLTIRNMQGPGIPEITIVETKKHMANTFPRLLQKHAAERPKAPALREKEFGIWQTWSWQRALDEVRWMAGGLAAGTVVGMGALAVKPLRSALGRWVLPKPGDGPTPAQQEAGHFDIRFSGTTASGGRIEAQVTGDRDPGYGSTAKMLRNSSSEEQ